MPRFQSKVNVNDRNLTIKLETIWGQRVFRDLAKRLTPELKNTTHRITGNLQRSVGYRIDKYGFTFGQEMKYPVHYAVYEEAYHKVVRGYYHRLLGRIEKIVRQQLRERQRRNARRTN